MKANIKISELPEGRIIWNGYNILGVTGSTLPKKYYEKYCVGVDGNELDYELIKINVRNEYILEKTER